MRSIRPAYRAICLGVAAALALAPTVAYAEPDASPSTTSTVTTPATATVSPKAPTPSAIPVPVDPKTEAFRMELERRQAALSEFRAQLDQLDTELQIASEAYNLAQADLETVRAQLSETQKSLGDAEVAFEEQQSLFSSRIEDMYRDGELSVAEILLGAKSLPDLLQRIEFIRTVTSADADVARELESQRQQIANHEVDLRQAEQKARALEFAMKVRKYEVELRLADREAMMAALQNDVLTLLDSEASRRTLEEMQLWRDIVAGVSKAGVTVEPNTPVETILAYHGIPYVWAGADPSGFDCSGLTMYVMKQHGVTLPHHAASQFLLGTPVQPLALRPGDLVFFGSPVYHVGMYVGGDYFVHAPRTGDYVKVSRLSERSDFVGARRYAWRFRVGAPAGVAISEMPSNLGSVR